MTTPGQTLFVLFALLIVVLFVMANLVRRPLLELPLRPQLTRAFLLGHSLRSLIYYVILALLLASLLANAFMPNESQKPTRLITLIIDVSGSMAVQDAVTTDGGKTITMGRRLDRAVARMTSFVETYRESRTIWQVIAAARIPTVVAPYTTDRAVVIASLRSLEIDVTENRTNLGDALALAIARELEKEQDDSAGVTHEVILATDGAQNVADTVDPWQAARWYQALGVRLSCLVLGPTDQTISEDRRRDMAQLSVLTALGGGRLIADLDATPDAVLAAFSLSRQVSPAIPPSVALLLLGMVCLWRYR